MVQEGAELQIPSSLFAQPLATHSPGLVHRPLVVIHLLHIVGGLREQHMLTFSVHGEIAFKAALGTEYICPSLNDSESKVSEFLHYSHRHRPAKGQYERTSTIVVVSTLVSFA